MKFKKGDRVKVVELATVDRNNTDLRVGMIGTVVGDGCEITRVKFDETFKHDAFNWHDGTKSYDMYSFQLELLKEERIVIYRKDNETIALNKLTGKKAIARCCPEDAFDFETGAKLAFERLMTPQVKEVKRHAEVGEYIKIVNACGCSIDEYKNGDILKVVAFDGCARTDGYTYTSGRAYYKNESWKYAGSDEYV